MNDQQKFQGNWKCSACDGAITELPFEPRGEANNLTCRDCFKSGKVAKKPAQNQGGGEKKMFEGNWKCSGCGGEITQLPFEPKSEANLTCRECYMKNK